MCSPTTQFSKLYRYYASNKWRHAPWIYKGYLTFIGHDIKSLVQVFGFIGKSLGVQISRSIGFGYGYLCSTNVGSWVVADTISDKFILELLYLSYLTSIILFIKVGRYIPTYFTYYLLQSAWMGGHLST